MSIQEQIDRYIDGQGSPTKRDELKILHRAMLRISPDCKLWFLDGRNEDGKIVSNPNIGYGSQATKYANGTTREFYQVGVSANTTGISLYVVGIGDKKYLSETYGKRLGKAKVTGYCIKFRTLRDVSLEVIEEIVRNHMGERFERSS